LRASGGSASRGSAAQPRAAKSGAFAPGAAGGLAAASTAGLASALAGALGHRRRGPRGRRAAALLRRAEAVATAETEEGIEEETDEEEDDEEEGEASGSSSPMVSPFSEDGSAAGEKPKLPLTWENVDMVLDELRPYLRNDGGDCVISEIDGPIVMLELQGSCQSCSASAVTLKMGIEKTLMERIPEIAEVQSVLPGQEPLSKEGIEEVLNGIRPFLSVSGGSIDLQDFTDNFASSQIILEMSGPPLKSTAVKVEVVNRMKRKYPIVQDVQIVACEDDDEEDRQSM